MSYLIVGLGNPGKKYRLNFHNLGFIAAEDAAILAGGKFKTKQCRALTAQAFINGEKLIIAKPETFMNLSGESVKELLKKHGLSAENLIVIYDDYDLAKGSLRIRSGGSAGSHNGMKNIVEKLGTQDFIRIRIGIKDTGNDIPIIDYVLSDISKADFSVFERVCKDAAQAAVDIASGAGIDAVMRKYNTSK